jgi:hypothetical protein
MDPARRTTCAELVKSFLTSLDAAYSDAAVEVDVKVSNASGITKF